MSTEITYMAEYPPVKYVNTLWVDAMHLRMNIVNAILIITGHHKSKYGDYYTDTVIDKAALNPRTVLEVNGDMLVYVIYGLNERLKGKLPVQVIDDLIYGEIDYKEARKRCSEYLDSFETDEENLEESTRMGLNEARRILKAKGYSLVKEMYDPPVDPPEGPDTEKWDDDCERQANEETDIAAESIEEGLKEKYPDIAVSKYDVKEVENSTDFYEGRDEWSYSKEFTCTIQLEIPPEAIGMSEETVKGELYPAKVYSFSEEAEQKIDELWAEAAEVNNSEIDFTDEYGSFYDPSYNMCVLQKSGTYKASQGNSRY